MKKTIYSITLLVVFILASHATALAQSGFEDLNMGDDSVYNGSDFSGGFSDGSFYFVNTYDTTGGFSSWSGFSASTISDSVTRGYRNQYASITGSGHQNSKHYAVAYSDSKIRLGSTRSVTGFYITNTTYAYYDMLDGSGFSKKFGGPSGNDPDYFKVIISAWKDAGNAADTSIEVYLADFRSDSSSDDYILKNWQYVNLAIFGEVDSFGFSFASSDTTIWGMATPAYFCMDDFNDIQMGISENRVITSFKAYPNPCTSSLTINEKDCAYEIINLSGQTVLAGFGKAVETANLENGIYLLKTSIGEQYKLQRFIKQ